MNYESTFKKLNNVIELIRFDNNLYDIFDKEELEILENSLRIICYTKKLRDEANKYMSKTWITDAETIRNSFSKYSSYLNRLQPMFNSNGNLENFIVDALLAKFKNVKLVFNVAIHEDDKQISNTVFDANDKNVNTTMSSIGVNFGYLFGHTTEDNIGLMIYNFLRLKLDEIDIFNDLRQIIDDKNK